MVAATKICQLAAQQIKRDPRLHEEGVRVHVECRPVGIYLTGTVPRLSQRHYAEQDLREVAGDAPLPPVTNEILVGESHPDGEVREKVVRALTEDPYVDETKIVVEVANGVVTLRGETQSLTRKRLAGAICWWIPGVRFLRNELVVTHPEEDNDDLLAEAVELVLDKDPLVDGTEVTVIVHDGLVHLIGTVGSDIARNAAEQDAYAVLGTRQVQNDLETVAPSPPPIA